MFGSEKLLFSNEKELNKARFFVIKFLFETFYIKNIKFKNIDEFKSRMNAFDPKSYDKYGIYLEDILIDLSTYNGNGQYIHYNKMGDKLSIQVTRSGWRYYLEHSGNIFQKFFRKMFMLPNNSGREELLAPGYVVDKTMVVLVFLTTLLGSIILAALTVIK